MQQQISSTGTLSPPASDVGREVSEDGESGKSIKPEEHHFSNRGIGHQDRKSLRTELPSNLAYNWDQHLS